MVPSFEIGLRLGELGREAWHQKPRLTSLWQTVMTLQASPETRLMRAEVQRHYPHIWQELQGLAQGLESTVDQVFAWNCRGDLVRSTSDGCTTVAGVTPQASGLSRTMKTVFLSYGMNACWLPLPRVAV